MGNSQFIISHTWRVPVSDYLHFEVIRMPLDMILASTPIKSWSLERIFHYYSHSLVQ